MNIKLIAEKQRKKYQAKGRFPEERLAHIFADLDVKIQEQNQLLKLSLVDWKSTAEESKSFLFSKDMEELRKNDFERFVNRVIFCYFNLSLFPDNEVLEKFKQFGFSKKTKWFISIFQIQHEFMKINSLKKYRIMPLWALDKIRIHLYFKLQNEILIENSLVRSVKTLHDELTDAFRAKKRFEELGTPFQNSKYGIVIEVINVLEKLYGSKEIAKNELLSSSQGRTESSNLAIILNECLYYYDSTNNAYRTIFDLFKLLCPDKNLLTKDEFLKSSTQSQTYGADYKMYQSNTIKKLISTTKEAVL